MRTPAPSPIKPLLSAKELDALHAAYEESGDPVLGKLLDRVCDDPVCCEEEE